MTEGSICKAINEAEKYSRELINKVMKNCKNKITLEIDSIVFKYL